jgi:hypothetical protein
VKDYGESYTDFQDAIFQELDARKRKYVANELIKMAKDAGMSQDELVEIVRSSHDEDGSDILNTLNARISERKNHNP